MRKVLWWTTGGFMAPPVVWLAAGFYFGLWNASELLRIVLSPWMWIYIAVFVGLVLSMIRTRMLAILGAKDAEPPVQQSTEHGRLVSAVNAIPLIFLVGMTIYCVVGPNVALLGQTLNNPFLDRAEYLFAQLLAIPLILLFSVPFFFMMTGRVERESGHIHLHPSKRYIGVRGKMLVGFVMSLLGIILTLIVAALSVQYEAGGAMEYQAFVVRLVVVSGVTALIAIINVLLMARELIGPLERLRTAMARIFGEIDQKHGGLAFDSERSVRDEVGYLECYFGEMLEALRGIIRDLKRLSGSSRLLIQEIVGSTDESLREATSTRERSQTMVRGQTELADELVRTDEETTAASERLSGMSASTGSTTERLVEVAVVMDEAKADAASARARADESSSELAGLTDLARLGANEIGESVRLVQEVVQQAAAIQSALSVINDIADRTSLLAMNASIQAAHAGEAGRGFAVVAGEIRSLSDNTHREAVGIGESLAELVASIGQTEQAGRQTHERFTEMVGVMDESAAAVNSLAQVLAALERSATHASDSLHAASSQTKQVASDAADVSDIVATASNDISRTRSVAGETREASADIDRRTTSLLERLRSSREQINEVSAQVASLADQVAGFSLD